MKLNRTLSLLAAIALLLNSASLAIADVEPGASRAEVSAALGSPSGEITISSATVLLYPRGQVKLRDDKVVQVNLLSEQAYEAQQRQNQARTERVRTEQSERMDRLEAEGRALYESTLKDPAFHRLPASEQVAFWQRFAARYPTIAVHSELATALQHAEQENRKAEEAQQMERLEARLATLERQPTFQSPPVYGLGFAQPWTQPWPYRARFLPKRPAAEPQPVEPDTSTRAQVMRQYEEDRRATYRSLGF